MGNLSANQSIFGDVDKDFEKVEKLKKKLSEQKGDNSTKGIKAQRKTYEDIQTVLNRISSKMIEIGKNSDNAFKFKSVADLKQRLKEAKDELAKLQKQEQQAEKDFGKSLGGIGFSEDEVKNLNSDDTTVKFTAKDSVFVDVFSDKDNILDAYKEFHPEDTTATVDDIWVSTLKTILINHIYNDLGFYVKKNGEAKFVILVEEQSAWNPNMTLRLLWYLSETLRNYIKDTQQRVHGSTRVKLPKIELYVVYTGDRNAPDEVSFKDDFYGGDCPVDLKAKILKKPGTGTVIGQYIGFSKIFNEQKAKHENVMDALEAAINMSIENGYLAEYLTAHKKEVVTMMAELFDEEKMREEDNAALRAEGIAEGETRGTLYTLLGLVKDGILTLADAAKRAHMTEDEFTAKTANL